MQMRNKNDEYERIFIKAQSVIDNRKLTGAFVRTQTNNQISRQSFHNLRVGTSNLANAKWTTIVALSQVADALRLQDLMKQHKFRLLQKKIKTTADQLAGHNESGDALLAAVLQNLVDNPVKLVDLYEDTLKNGGD